jgi:hypothetical protein
MTTRKNHVNRIKSRREIALYNLERRFPMLAVDKAVKAAAEITVLRSRIASLV